MSPQGAPTTSFSARCASRDRPVPVKVQPEAASSARSVATSSAALLLTPIDVGTSEVIPKLSPSCGRQS